MDEKKRCKKHEELRDAAAILLDALQPMRRQWAFQRDADLRAFVTAQDNLATALDEGGK